MSDTECLICLEEIGKNEISYITKCNHLYHKKCIIKSLNTSKEKNKCPYCRQKLGNNILIKLTKEDTLCKNIFKKGDSVIVNSTKYKNEKGNVLRTTTKSVWIIFENKKYPRSLVRKSNVKIIVS
jgi:hypothetical protein|tara:strand:- start:11715 stop:12089 length:375 start_codon:yes stop_codon:yes gene_type:complete